MTFLGKLKEVSKCDVMEKYRAPSLKSILRAHQEHKTATSLRSNLGDGYLFRFNSTFRYTRTLVTRFGYGFTDEDFCNYATLPLAALPQILKKKLIPWFDNSSALAKLERRKPGR